MARPTAPRNVVACDEWINRIQGEVLNWVEKTKALNNKGFVACPSEGKGCFPAIWKASVIRVAEHLNDHHKWSWERICEWLDQQEPVTL